MKNPLYMEIEKWYYTRIDDMSEWVRGRCEKKWLWTFSFYHIHIIYDFFFACLLAGWDIITNCVMHYTPWYTSTSLHTYIIALNFTSEQICISNSMCVCCAALLSILYVWCDMMMVMVMAVCIQQFIYYIFIFILYCCRTYVVRSVDSR